MEGNKQKALNHSLCQAVRMVFRKIKPGAGARKELRVNIMQEREATAELPEEGTAGQSPTPIPQEMNVCDMLQAGGSACQVREQLVRWSWRCSTCSQEAAVLQRETGE